MRRHDSYVSDIRVWQAVTTVAWECGTVRNIPVGRSVRSCADTQVLDDKRDLLNMKRSLY